MMALNNSAVDVDGERGTIQRADREPFNKLRK